MQELTTRVLIAESGARTREQHRNVLGGKLRFELPEGLTRPGHDRYRAPRETLVQVQLPQTIG